ncbi:hypothetical protein BC939DRAFT_445135 [Gamsiella multidivaricata]|uniref:uncharacterized protein n=1 Tax=Gamsiella multidivaricata TaxID=101098 RepID=UPI00221EA64A|nr:uncharacterized protein BC939DRAFT_445135 [Gamsiella multidivaricata]KAI7827411.1 hypothetical protein BC939DRAFT_445135 [Gamsiella multidivaricata]
MIDIELNPPKGTAKPALPDPATIDSDIYVIWCESSNGEDYRERLFRLIENFREKEEKERKRLRDLDTRVYENDDSPHRRHLQSKVALVKQAVFDFQPQKAAGKKRPGLSSDAYSMDVDVFLLWCIQTRAYRLSSWMNYCSIDRFYVLKNEQNRYELDSVTLVNHLEKKDEEERQYLVERSHKRDAHTELEI